MEIGRQFEINFKLPLFGIGVTVALAHGGGKSDVESGYRCVLGG